ncbi:unnamed protein product [Nippostrongylus brasiliensis]|uniref:GOLD domain-containing protein n=1 Tax=Nippostrongylus brasiliensis TaxID=27835 RepID=A0A0N4Y9I1_NIPBR|nr:unnamed protein product [Nippostrongylus brasiliensis]
MVPFKMSVYLHMMASSIPTSAFMNDTNAWMLNASATERAPNVLLSMYRNLNTALYIMRSEHKVFKRDIGMQRRNASFITWYVVVFCISAIITSMAEVAIVRRMFRAY